MKGVGVVLCVLSSSSCSRPGGARGIVARRLLPCLRLVWQGEHRHRWKKSHPRSLRRWWALCLWWNVQA